MTIRQPARPASPDYSTVLGGKSTATPQSSQINPSGGWDIGLQNGQMNVWNSSQNDGSVPWSDIFAGQAPGATIANGQVPHYPGSTAYGGGGGLGGGGGGPGYSPNTGSDAYLKSALDRLQGTVSGQNLPYDATTRGNLMSKASDMNAAAESSNAQDVQARVAANGGSANDPATQAALSHLKSQRQGANSTAAQNIDSQAGVANFQAQQQAAGGLADTRLKQASVDPNYNGSASMVGGQGVQPAGGAGGGGGGGGAAAPGSQAGNGWYGPGNGTVKAGGHGAYANPSNNYIGANGQTDFAAMAKNGLDWKSAWRGQQNAAVAARTPAGSYGWQR